ncbi:MAG: leucine-rich repeat protein [Clostridia bacterium]|nr:leucine-rich repeat protein [Clostridia bacterium]
MKKTFLMALLCCLLITGCAGKGNQPAGGEDTTSPTTDTGQQSDVPLDDRLAYYQQRITELQDEVLALKSELYVAKVGYEAEISRLQAKLEASTPKDPDKDTVGTQQQFTYVIEDGKAVITGYTGNEVDLEIPERLDGYPVVAIGERAFEKMLRLKSVMIPDSVTSIGWFAFSGCIALETVSVPASVVHIDYGAFLNCGTGLIVYCTSGSYAEQYARSYGIRTGA